MKCYKCGKELNEGALICYDCGAPKINFTRKSFLKYYLIKLLMQDIYFEPT